MLELCGRGPTLCDGLSRRTFLRVGGLAGLSWPGLLTGSARAATGTRRARSVIQLFMWGGPAQQETFDLKPDAPEAVRSLVKPITTATPGIRISEHLPLLARRTPRYAILRSVTHTGVNHGTSAYHMLTGHIHPAPGTLRHPTPSDLPNVGCAASRFGPRPRELPTYVSLPSVLHDGDGGEVPGQGPGLLGGRFTPFQVLGDPTRQDFSLDTLRLPTEVGATRFRDRVGLHQALDQRGDRLAATAAADVDANYDRAFRLLESPVVRRAFDLAAEPEAVRRRYGWHRFGQSCLLARRLAEAGVPMITVYWNSSHIDNVDHWDTHKNSVERLREHLLPPLDTALSALLDDLHGRGLLDDTLIVWMGEFGRTPRINRQGGRDHWGFCQSVLMAGAGVRGGQVYGSSDGHAAYAAELPVSPDDLAASVFTALGVPLDAEMTDPQGRPLPVCRGKVVAGLY
jgi:hypothetical protein